MDLTQGIAPRARASILGASGYSGAELLHLLLSHRAVAVEHVFAQASVGQQVSALHPRFAGRTSLTFERYTPDAACTSDVVFIALPSGESLQIVPDLLARGKKVIDLGGDFRLNKPETYQKFYHRAHSAPDLLGTAVYGLTELNRDQIQHARFVSNPGCYPTGALLPLIPLLKRRIIDRRAISITSLSGVSGAGRSSSLELSFAEVNESVRAYKVGVHQHIPEIRQVLEASAGAAVSFTFVPHLLPITRGIYTTITAPLNDGMAQADVKDAYDNAYGDEPFVRVSATATPEIKNVLYTNCIDIGFHLDLDQRTITILTAIDNLVKGAAGQAVQNMNLMCGFPETEGLR